MPPKKRRVVKRKKTIPKISELKAVANSHGMTVWEYVNHLAQMNRDHTGKRNRSAYLDMGPEVYNHQTGLYDRAKKGIKKKEN